MPRPGFLRKLRRYVAALPALAFGFIASPAFSATVVINAAGVNAGATTASFLGGTLTTTGGGFSKSTTPGSNPSALIGVSGGYVGTEVDISGEKLTLSFGPTGAIVDEIVVGMMFLSTAGGDTFNEAMQLQTNGGTSCASGNAFCILSASGVWRGSTLGVQIISPATSGNGGIFKISNPFGSILGNELVSSIDFLPFFIGGSGATSSDFGLVSVTYTTTAIPEPGTLGLVGFGLLGLAFAGRKRARSEPKASEVHPGWRARG